MPLQDKYLKSSLDDDYLDLYLAICGCTNTKKSKSILINSKTPNELSLSEIVEFIKLMVPAQNFNNFKSFLSIETHVEWNTFRRIGTNNRRATPQYIEAGLSATAQFLEVESLKEIITIFLKFMDFKNLVLPQNFDYKNIISGQEYNVIHDFSKSSTNDIFFGDSLKSTNILHYANQELDFIGRDREFKLLLNFLESDMSFCWIQIAGSAGQGKSRLAYEVMIYAKKNGWDAGFFKGKPENNYLEFNLWRPKKPCLLIFDDIKNEEYGIKNLFQSILKTENIEKPIRVIFIERNPFCKTNHLPRDRKVTCHTQKKAEWFIRLCLLEDGSDEKIWSSKYRNGYIELQGLEKNHLESIVNKAYFKKNKKELNVHNDNLYKKLNSIDKEGRPLYAYLFGFILSENNENKIYTLELMLDEFLESELSYISIKKEDYYQDAAYLLALATITKGLDLDRFRLKDYDLNNILSTRLLNFEENKICPLFPDILGCWFLLFSHRYLSDYKELIYRALEYNPKETCKSLLNLAVNFYYHPTTYLILNIFPTRKNYLNYFLPFSIEIGNIYLDNEIHPPKNIIKIIKRYISSKDEDKWLFLSSLSLFRKNNTASKYYLRRAIWLNSSEGMRRLANHYFIGKRKSKYINKSIDLLMKSSHLGNALAFYDLGVTYRDGVGVDRCLKKAFSYWEKAASLGDINSMNELGISYESGLGIKKDKLKAIKWLNKGAYHGHVLCMLNLASTYCNKGNCSNEEARLAIYWWERAAELNHDEAFHNLAISYRTGFAIKKDLARSVEYWLRAAQNNHVDSMFNLGVCYMNGVGVREDYDKAVFWWENAAKHGNIKALFNLGIFFRDENRNIEKTIDYLNQAAKMGCLESMCDLGNIYYYYKGYENHKLAISWWEKSSSSGNPLAMYHLGLAYLESKAVQGKEEAGLLLLRKSTSLGNDLAREKLNELEKN